MFRSGCVAETAAAGLIRAQVAHSQHIRIRLQPLKRAAPGPGTMNGDIMTNHTSACISHGILICLALF